MSRYVHKYKGYVISAAGVVPYCYCKGENRFYFLMQVRDGSYLEDFGGKADDGDKAPLMTAIRECVEESNASLFEGKCKNIDEYKKRMNNECKSFMNHVKNQLGTGEDGDEDGDGHRAESVYEHLIPQIKYALYFVRFSKKFMKKTSDSSIFSDHEFHDGFERKVVWVGEDDVGNYILHPRLRDFEKIVAKCLRN